MISRYRLGKFLEGWGGSLVAFAPIVLSVALGVAFVLFKPYPTIAATNTPPGLPDFAQREYAEMMNAPIEVALVFGHARGCENAAPELVNTVAHAAVSAHMPPRVLAATIAVESQCDRFAVSSKGAIGLAQVMPKIWNPRFNFADRYNLFNEADNVRVGAAIMSALIREHGLQRGVQLYNGAGVGCDTCDAGYSTRVLALAGK